MIKKRLIFTLLLDGNDFMLSRNFRLQKVGNLSWIKKHYDFNAIAFAIDELIVLNVSREKKDLDSFCLILKELTKSCFMPVAAGGGIRSLKDAEKILNSGADKLVINTPLYRFPEIVKELVKYYGSQCVVASIDYRDVKGEKIVFINDGNENTNLTLEKAIEVAEDLGVGELFLNSIEKDGTGMGYDIETLYKINQRAKTPIIASGGAGKFEHFLDVFKRTDVSGASTANLFYFVADGLIETRNYLKKNGLELAEWDFGFKTNRIAIFIPARLSSTRLPKKMLIDINGKPALWYLIKRMEKAKKPDLRVICTTNMKEDDEIEKFSIENNWLFFRGDAEDVLRRYLEAADHFGVEFFINVDGDDLFCSTEYVDKIIEKYLETNSDYISVEGLPFGATPIGVKVEALREVCNLKKEKDTQGWGKYFLKSELFSINILDAEPELKRPHFRMSLDYEEDLEFFKILISKLGLDNLNLPNIIKFLDENPEIASISQKVTEKYWERFNKMHRNFRLKNGDNK